MIFSFSVLYNDNFFYFGDALLKYKIFLENYYNILIYSYYFSIPKEWLIDSFKEISFLFNYISDSSYTSYFFFENDLYNYISEIFLLMIIFFFFLFLLFFDKKNSLFFFIYNGGLFVLLLLFLFYFNYSFFFDGFEYNFIKFFKLFLLFFSILSLYITKNYLFLENIRSYEYFILFFFFIFSSLWILSCHNFLVLYLVLELQTFCLFIMVSYKTNSVLSLEAGVKYFILGSLSSAFLLLGICFLYGSLGTLDFYEIHNLLFNYQFDFFFKFTSFFLGLLFISVGLFFKLGAAPFHIWVLDVYEGAPNVFTLFISIVPKIIAFFLVSQIFFFLFFSLFEVCNQILNCVGLLSLFIGTLGAIQQTKIKSFYGYSGISNIGYMLIGFANNLPIYVIILYFCIYLLNSISFFLVFLCLYKKNKDFSFFKITDFKYFSKTNPLLAVSFVVTLFSMAGIPPLAGFYGKLYILNELINQQLYVIAFFFVFVSTLATFYYLRIIKITTFDIVKYNFKGYSLFVSFPYFMYYILSSVLFFNIFFYWIFPFFFFCYFYYDLNIFIFN